MRNVIMGLFMVVAAMNVYAIDCKELSNTAKDLMEIRQQGYSMSTLMEAAEGSELAQALVIEAYRQPRYNSERYKKQAVEDFTNSVYLQCLEAKK